VLFSVQALEMQRKAAQKDAGSMWPQTTAYFSNLQNQLKAYTPAIALYESSLQAAAV
jgi:hypothetical protein